MKGKKILIIITGGIAGYKINHLVRDFIKNEAEVRVILTPSAKNFVSPLTLSTLSKNPVLSDFYTQDGHWNNHIDWALWADVLLIAPCTAHTISKMAQGICDNFALAVYFSARCPVFVAPAMDLDMYIHPAIAQNIEKVKTFPRHFIFPAEYGELASGLVGIGRMPETEKIFNQISDFFQKENETQIFHRKKILITAGPTYQPIDPVRFIGNHSSGKMGYALAQKAAEKGAEVFLISGPSQQKISHPSIKKIEITSAQEMKEAVFSLYDQVDIAIAAAAVADFTPKIVAEQKIKKNEDTMILELVKTPDILLEMGKKKKNQILVGFALETENEEKNAENKLIKKNLDMIVLNSLQNKGAGFQTDTNQIKIITPNQKMDFPLKNKTEVAEDILNFIDFLMKNKIK